MTYDRALMGFAKAISPSRFRRQRTPYYRRVHPLLFGRRKTNSTLLGMTGSLRRRRRAARAQNQNSYLSAA
jgi:hypothetical protein